MGSLNINISCGDTAAEGLPARNTRGGIYVPKEDFLQIQVYHPNNKKLCAGSLTTLNMHIVPLLKNYILRMGKCIVCIITN